MSYVGSSEDRSRREDMFEAFKHTLLKLGPYPGFALPSEQVERSYDVGEIRNELPIKVCKSGEQPDSLDGGMGFPFLYGIKFLLIHPDLSLSDDHTQKLHARGVKYTFREFDR